MAVPGCAGAQRSLACDGPRLRTLGGFELRRDGQLVNPAEWRSKKALDLLKLLVARQRRLTGRELLCDLLWPDEDPGRCANRLSVALSTVRTILDPEKRFAADQFISTDKYAVQLTNLPVDVERFLVLSERALDLHERGDRGAFPALVHAATAYTGEFLPTDPRLEWSGAVREHARASYLELVRVLGDGAERMGEYEQAMAYRMRALHQDPYDEEGHLGLVRALVATGRLADARRRYLRYVDQMAELGLDPAPFPFEVVPVAA
jgi:DNA-binding SARP family transcriptional activator